MEVGESKTLEGGRKSAQMKKEGGGKGK